MTIPSSLENMGYIKESAIYHLKKHVLTTQATDIGFPTSNDNVADESVVDYNKVEPAVGVTTVEWDFRNVSPIATWLRRKGPFSAYKTVGQEAAKRAAIMSDEIKQVTIRHKSCFITGISAAEAKMEVIWIVPPTMVWNIHNSWWSKDYSSYTTPDNAILVSANLVQFYLENRFGIDVDDEYRLVAFRDMDGVILPSHLPNARVSEMTDLRLREHFAWTLKVNFCGGDIREDYQDSETRAIMESLGALGTSEPLAPLSDPLWQNELGKEILQARMEMELGFGGLGRSIPET